MITLAHEPSITGVKVCREIFDFLAAGDFSGALKRLDQTKHKWTKARLIARLEQVGCAFVGDWRKMKKSACPSTDYFADGFVFRHKIPGKLSWSEASLILTFTKKPGTFICHLEMDIQ